MRPRSAWRGAELRPADRSLRDALPGSIFGFAVGIENHVDTTRHVVVVMKPADATHESLLTRIGPRRANVSRLNHQHAAYVPCRNQSDGCGQRENSTEPRRHRTPSMIQTPLTLSPFVEHRIDQSLGTNRHRSSQRSRRKLAPLVYVTDQ